MIFQYIGTMPKKHSGDNNVIVVSCEGDQSLCKPAISAGISIVNSEFILTGILKQEVDVDKYPLIN